MAKFQRSLLARSIAVAIAAPAASLIPHTVAQAEEPATDQAAAPDESAATAEASGAKLQQVVVSARRTRENPQKVPISISTFSEDSLEREDIRTATDLEKNVPGLAICCGKGRALYNFVRGIQGVQSYFAETPMLGVNGGATSLAGNSMYFDLDNLAVLKGPQGTLFGMSTNGGALLFAPNKPTSTFGGYISGEVGDYGRRIVEGVVNVPINDMLKVRIALQSVFVDGYVTDLSTGNRLGSDDYKVGRVVVSFKPSASIDNDLYINEYHSSGKLPPYVPVAVNPNGAARAAIGPALDDFIARQNQLGPYKLVGTSLPGSIENTNNVKQTNVANITSVRLTDDFSLKNILGYSRLSSYEVFDADGTPYKIYDNNVPGSTPAGASELMTEELQAQGKALGGKFTYTGGVFYARSHPGKAGTVIADLTDVFGIQTSTTATAKFQTEAIYAQGTYDLDDSVKGLKATAGYRFTTDKRWLDQTSALIIPSIDLTIPNAPLNLKSESKNSSYTLGLTYQATPKTMYYFTNSKGFLNGGFNTSVTQAADAPYGPESLNNFELGVKSDFELGGMQARANVAAYYGLYNDAQVSVTTLINAGTPQQALAVLTKNAAKGTIKGLEWNLQLVPSQYFQIAFFGSYMKNEYTKYASLDGQGQPIDLSGTPFVFVPKLKYGLSATAFMPIDEAYGELGVTASFTHQDEVITTSTLHPQWYDKGSAIDNLNLSVNWDQVMGKKGLSAAFFVNNALGQDDSNSGFGAYNSLGVFGLVAPPPRMYGLRVKQTF